MSVVNNAFFDYQNQEAKPDLEMVRVEGRLAAKRSQVAAKVEYRWQWTNEIRLVPADLSRFTRQRQHTEPIKLARTGDALEDLKNEYRIALVGGKACVVRWRSQIMPDGQAQDHLDMIRKGDFITFHGDKIVHEKVHSKDSKGNAVTDEVSYPATTPFFREAKRYDGLCYLPHEGPEVHGALNLWRGFAVVPKPGSWARMQEHIYEVLCSSVPEQANYLIKWCAWLVQNPGVMAEVAGVLREREGAGKGVFVQSLLQIFGIHGLHISGRKHLVGNFNKHLMYCSFLYGDEVFWGGEKKETGELKRIITEPSLTIEPKTVDSFQMPNCLHIIMASNEDWVVPASQEARRFAIFDVSPKRIGDRAYFERLWAEKEQGGVAAMLYDLLCIDLQGWHPRDNVPNTKGLQDQKILSISGVDAIVLMLAHEGVLPLQGAKPHRVITTGEKDDTGFLSWAKRSERTLKYAKGTDIKRSLIERWGCKAFSSDGKRYLDFPSLQELRSRIDKTYGPQDWDNPEVMEWQPGANKGSSSWHSFE